MLYFIMLLGSFQPAELKRELNPELPMPTNNYTIVEPIKQPERPCIMVPVEDSMMFDPYIPNPIFPKQQKFRLIPLK